MYAIKKTLFATSSDEAKQLLTGVHLSFNTKNMEAAATDGHRLAILNTIDNKFLSSSDEEVDFDSNDILAVTLPARSLREVERLISSSNVEEPISLFFDQGQVVFISNDQVVTSRTLEGVYPNYKQLIPDEFSRCLILNRHDLILALERIAVLADQHNNVVKFSIDSSAELLKISADAQDVGSGSESLPVLLDGEGIDIAFNVRYVLDGLKVIESEKIILRCNAPTTPAILSPDDENSLFTYLVMPVQIRS